MNNNQSLVTVQEGQPVTTSLIIAEGTGNDHHSVIKLIRRYEDDLNLLGTFRFQIQKSGGRPTQYALLNEQQTTLLMTYMQNTEVIRKFKIRLVQAFYEMARNHTYNVPQTRAEALRLAADLEEQNEQLRIENQVLQPKAQGFDRLCDLEEGRSLSLTEAAKHLQMGRNKLIQRLFDLKWIYKTGSSSAWQSYQRIIDQGLLTHKIVITGSEFDGNEKSHKQVKVTDKGLQRLATLLEAKEVTY